MNHNDQSVYIGRRQYYSSSQGPFYNANNIFMFYGGGNRGCVVKSIIKALEKGKATVHVHGEAGSGKTMLSLVLSDRVKHRFHTMRYDLADISASKLLRHLLIELAPQDSHLISAEQAQSGADEGAIEQALLCLESQLGKVRHARNNKPYLLFIDSKESIGGEILNVIERLSTFNVDHEPILYSVVFHTTASNAERYAAVSDIPYQAENHFWLRRLTLVEISDYLRHHMMLYDFNRRDLFTREMAYFIADRSEGVFKSINTLARNAFTIANLEEADRLSMSHLLMAGMPLSPEQKSGSRFMARHRKAVVTLSAASALAIFGTILFLLR